MPGKQRYLLEKFGQDDELAIDKMLKQWSLVAEFIIDKLSQGVLYEKIKNKKLAKGSKTLLFKTDDLRLCEGKFSMPICTKNFYEVLFLLDAPSNIARDLLKQSYYTSFTKFRKFTLELFEHIFDDEQLEQIYEKHPSLVDDPIDSFNYPCIESPVITDGFIAEGKTDFWSNQKGGMDTEIDFIFRMKMKNGKFPNQKILGVYSLFGIVAMFLDKKNYYTPMKAQGNEKVIPDKLYFHPKFNRFFISLDYFNHFNCDKALIEDKCKTCEYNGVIMQKSKVWAPFYMSLLSTFSPSWCIRFFKPKLWSELQPLKEYRQMEMLLYQDKMSPDNKLCLFDYHCFNIWRIINKLINDDKDNFSNAFEIFENLYDSFGRLERVIGDKRKLDESQDSDKKAKITDNVVQYKRDNYL